MMSKIKIDLVRILEMVQRLLVTNRTYSLLEYSIIVTFTSQPFKLV
jgi:hypothetical protein